MYRLNLLLRSSYQWKMMFLAHTKDAQAATLEKRWLRKRIFGNT